MSYVRTYIRLTSKPVFGGLTHYGEGVIIKNGVPLQMLTPENGKMVDYNVRNISPGVFFIFPESLATLCAVVFA